jgi:hypothetical protein
MVLSGTYTWEHPEHLVEYPKNQSKNEFSMFFNLLDLIRYPMPSNMPIMAFLVWHQYNFTLSKHKQWALLYLLTC